MLYDGVNDAVESVEKLDDLQRRGLGGEFREADNVAEENGHGVIRLSLDLVSL